VLVVKMSEWMVRWDRGGTVVGKREEWMLTCPSTQIWVVERKVGRSGVEMTEDLPMLAETGDEVEEMEIMEELLILAVASSVFYPGLILAPGEK
jgi:hypothetical protein